MEEKNAFLPILTENRFSGNSHRLLKIGLNVRKNKIISRLFLIWDCYIFELIKIIRKVWKKKSFNLFYFVILISGVLYTNVCFSQNTPTTWQDRLEALKNSFNEENRGDVSFLKLLGYTYKGIIGSQTVKSDIIDSLLSYNAPAILHLPPIVMRDTVSRGDSCVIRERMLPKFEIISIRKRLEIAESIGEKSLLTSLRQPDNNLIHLDYEYLELEWSYKNKHFKSLCVVSNEHGGFIYDPIGSNILEYTTTTTTNTVERLNSKENLH